MLSSVYTRHTRTRIFFFSSSCEPCLKNLQGPPLPFWSEWALITSCRLAEAWPWPQSRFKWWSSTTRFKKPRHISVLQLRNQSWNRCHHAEKQTLQGRHTLDELFLLARAHSDIRIQFSDSYKQILIRPTQVQWTRNKLSRITESLPRPNAEHQPNFAK